MVLAPWPISISQLPSTCNEHRSWGMHQSHIRLLWLQIPIIVQILHGGKQHLICMKSLEDADGWDNKTTKDIEDEDVPGDAIDPSHRIMLDFCAQDSFD